MNLDYSKIKIIIGRNNSIYFCLICGGKELMLQKFGKWLRESISP